MGILSPVLAQTAHVRVQVARHTPGLVGQMPRNYSRVGELHCLLIRQSQSELTYIDDRYHVCRKDTDRVAVF